MLVVPLLLMAEVATKLLPERLTLAVAPAPTVRPSPLSRSSTASVPELTRNRSLPRPPSRVSLPPPPSRVSSPASPSRLSLLAPPSRLSLPSPPNRVSLPLPPRSRSLSVRTGSIEDDAAVVGGVPLP